MQLRIEHLPCTIEQDVVVPSFLGAVDHPWLQRLIERASGAAGLRAADVDEHLMAPLPIPAHIAKHRLAAHTLARGLAYRTDAPVEPALARERTFGAAASSDAPRGEVLAQVAASFGVSTDDLAVSLFADLPAERTVVGLIEQTSPTSLAAKANAWLAGAYVSRATRVRIEVVGASRNLVRAAKNKGLLCAVTGTPDEAAAVLELSGPLSLFKRTRIYGRALSSLLPTLPWCDRWILEAECVVQGRPVRFRLSTGAPIEPGGPPKRFDSKVEQRFAEDMARRAPEWSAIREPRPIAAGESLVFPDFALQPPGGDETFLVELVGFWTPAYLEEKLARYRRARLTNLVLCIDEDLGCADVDVPPQARVVPFRRRVDVARVLAACGYDVPLLPAAAPKRRRRPIGAPVAE